MDNLSVNKRYCSISSARSSPLRFRKNKTLERKNRRRENRRNCTWTTHKYYPPKSQIIPSIFQTHLDSNQNFNPKIKPRIDHKTLLTTRFTEGFPFYQDPICVGGTKTYLKFCFHIQGRNFGVSIEILTLLFPAEYSNELRMYISRLDAKNKFIDLQLQVK